MAKFGHLNLNQDETAAPGSRHLASDFRIPSLPQQFRNEPVHPSTGSPCSFARRMLHKFAELALLTLFFALVLGGLIGLAVIEGWSTSAPPISDKCPSDKTDAIRRLTDRQLQRVHPNLLTLFRGANCFGSFREPIAAKTMHDYGKNPELFLMQTEKDMQNSENFDKQNDDSSKNNGHSSRNRDTKQLTQPKSRACIEALVEAVRSQTINIDVDIFRRFVLGALIDLVSKGLDVPSGFVVTVIRGLMTDLDDHRSIVRQTAAFALGELASSPSVQFGLTQQVLLALAQATEDIDSRVCLTAAEAGIKILSAVQT